jgi:probable rRNA maturation factor
MILLDPVLDPDPAALSTRSAVPASHRLPPPQSLVRFLRAAQAEVKLRGHVTVLLSTDAAIRRLNRRFRGIDKPTDVLSFPAEAFVRNQEEIAGDLAISVPTARRQATEQGHSLATELKVLILHGVLHLAGYDHESDSGQMARRERKLRAQLNLPQGLIERTHKLPVILTEWTRSTAPRKRVEGSAVIGHPQKRVPGAPSLERSHCGQGCAKANIGPTAGGRIAVVAQRSHRDKGRKANIDPTTGARTAGARA